MSTTAVTEHVPPTQEESRLASSASRRLARCGQRNLKLQIVGQRGDAITLPASAVQHLVRLLSEMASGNSMALVPLRAELTTQEAADVLGVSRPFLVRLLKAGAIPSRKVGTHRRVHATDLMAYRHAIDQQRLKTLAELTAQAQQLNMGY
jgi:excisionase family DNA binding protein